MSRDRDAFAQVGTAIRRGGDLMLGGNYTEADFRVWAVIVNSVASWSRLSETLWRDDIAEDARRSDKTVSRSLKKMHRGMVITWEPGRRNVPSKLTIHPTFEDLLTYRRSKGLDAPPVTASHSGDPLGTSPDEPSAEHSEDPSETSETSQRDTQTGPLNEESEKTEEEVVSPEWEPFMLRSDDANRDEFAEVFSAIAGEHGIDVGCLVLDRLAGRRYRWASQFRKAIAREVPTVIAERMAQRAEEPTCVRCDGHGVYEVPGDQWAQCDHSTHNTERRAS